LKSLGHCLYNVTRSKTGNNLLQVSYGDFTSEFINNHRIEVIIHLAGKAHDLKNTSTANEYYEVNTELTKKVYDIFRLSNARQFYFMSTVKAVADSANNPLSEDTRANPITVYGKSKYAAEEYLMAHRNNNQQVYILRPCMIHGNGNKGNLNLLYGYVRRNLPWPLASYDNKRSFLYIDNLCFVIGKMIEKRTIIPGIYNVADSDSLSTNQLIAIMSTELGKRPFFLYVPRVIVETFASVGTVLKLPFNKERVDKLTENYVVNNNKLLNAIGEQLPFTITDGIRLTIKSFKEKHNNLKL
ncbi:MAG: NAD-dependent epimerase/dehydratase family protein, partial [Sediminibacterium sp.]